jgi:hypothetical protein
MNWTAGDCRAYARIEDIRILHPQMDVNIIDSVNGCKKMVKYNTIGRTCIILEEI